MKLSENASFSLEDVLKIIFQILLAVNYLEKKGINLMFVDPKRILINEESLSIKIRNYIVDVLFKPDEMKFIK